MVENTIGFHEDPKNGDGIIRAKTTLQIRSWDMPRAQKSIEQFNTEIGKAEFPGIYILFAKNSKLYIGEAKNIYNRIKTHMSMPDDKIKDWDRVLIINDGRPAAQSDFNDTVVRRALEIYLGRLLRANRWFVVSQGEPQILNSIQKHTVDSLVIELNTFLKRKNIITKVLEERGQEEVFHDELRKILEKAGRKTTAWGAYEAEVDGQRTFIRPGSKKSKGWQITFRDIFLSALKQGDGYLLVPRDGVLLIPLNEIQRVITDDNAYNQNTIDIWITFGEEETLLSYRDNSIEVTQFKLVT